MGRLAISDWRLVRRHCRSEVKGMRWKGATVMVALMTITMAVGQQPKVRIVLRDKVAVANPIVRLGDIAEVIALSDEGEKLLPTLLDLPIAPSPLPRYQRVLTTGEVATRLAQAGWRNSEFILDGAKRVVITRTGRTLTASELESLLQKALNTPVKLLLPPPPIIIPDGEVSVQTELPPSPRSLLSVTLLVNGQPVANFKVLVQVGSNERFTVGNQPQIANHQSPVAAFLVRRRQTVRLIARVGKVVVEAQGMALQDGKLGDEILVAVAWSKTPLKGIVSGEREVTISAW
jgi:hypothetical protein